MRSFFLFHRAILLHIIICSGLLFHVITCLGEDYFVPHRMVQSGASARSQSLYSRDRSLVPRKLGRFKNTPVEPVQLTCPHDTFLPYIHPATRVPLWFSRIQYDARGNNLTNWCIRNFCICNYDQLSHEYKLECLSIERYAMLKWCEITCHCEESDGAHH
jgi:hypothetical protein